MAKANIERALQMLDPEECAIRYELPNIMARDSFHLERERVDNVDEFLDVCIRYYTHHFNRVYVAEGAPPPDLTRGRLFNILEHNYRGGFEASCKSALRGVNAALSGVLDSIRDYFLKDQEEHYFNYAVMECVDVMDLDDIKALMEQYVERYGRYLDGGHMPTAEYLVPKFRQVIKAHAQVVHNVRSQFGK